MDKLAASTSTLHEEPKNKAIDYDHNFFGDPRNVQVSLDYRF